MSCFNRNGIWRFFGAITLNFLSVFSLQAQFYQYNNPIIEQKIDTLLAKMSLSEKLGMLGGYRNGRIKGIAQAKIPDIKTADWGQYSNISQLNLAATWDSSICYKWGKHIAQTAKLQGVKLLMGPDLNLYRSALSPDNELHWSEDPVLSAGLSGSLLRAVQGQRIMVAPMGYVADYKEYTQKNIQFQAAERTMEELYLYPYRMAVLRSKVAGMKPGAHFWAYPPAERLLYLNYILKGEFLFEGISLAQSEDLPTALTGFQSGIDVELPFGTKLKADTLDKMLQKGSLSTNFLDDKLKRILRMGMYFSNSAATNTLTSQSLAADKILLEKEIAQNSLILLENKNALPMPDSLLQKTVIVGKEVNTLFENWKNKGNPVMETFTESSVVQEFICYINDSLLRKGVVVQQFNGNACKDNPILTTYLDKIDKMELPATATRYDTWIETAETDSLVLNFLGRDGVMVWVDEQLVWEDWRDCPARWSSKVIPLSPWDLHHIVVEHYQTKEKSRFQFGYSTHRLSVPTTSVEAAIAVAQQAVSAVVVLGYSPTQEAELGRKFDLPNVQLNMLQQIYRKQKNTYVVLMGGGSLNISAWKDSVKAIVHILHPQAQTGNAVLDLCIGGVSPSGRLPFSYEQKWEHSSVFSSYQDTIKDGKFYFSEELNLGYRGYVSDEDLPKPLYPFGYGLSYGQFIYSNLQISPNNFKGDGNVMISFDVTNIGKMTAADVPQIYLHDPQSSLPRPKRELKTWTKVLLKPNETRHITLPLTAEELAFYHPDRKQWIAENGVFEVQLGKNATDISLKAPFVYSGERAYVKTKRKRAKN